MALILTFLSAFFVFYFFHLSYRSWFREYLIGDAERWIESSINIIAFLLLILIFFAFAFIVVLRAKAHDLKEEIAERIIAEKQREEIKQALLQSQKLEAIGMLAGGVAHNFNNILYAIQGYVQMTRSDIDQSSISYQNLGRVLEAVERGQELIKGILSFSRRDRYHLEPLKLKELMESTIQLLRSSISSSVELVVNMNIEDQVLEGSRAQLQQVFINIIRNAADALDEKGRVEIDVKIESDKEELKLLRQGLSYASYFVISIKDNGSGMSEETLRHLFEPFFTTKDVGKGTGLGLATARSIVRDHYGEVIVQSVLNKGSVFIVLLPLMSKKLEIK